jgi:hypothetical protein
MPCLNRSGRDGVSLDGLDTKEPASPKGLVGFEFKEETALTSTARSPMGRISAGATAPTIFGMVCGRLGFRLTP